MFKDKPTILIVDDDEAIISTLNIILSKIDLTILSANSPAQALMMMKQFTIDLSLIDLNYQDDTTSGKEGLDLIENMKLIDNEIPIIVMTGWSGVDIAIQAMKRGAVDYIEKPWENERLINIIKLQLQLIDKVKQNKKLKEENKNLKSNDIENTSVNIIAESSAMREVLRLLKIISRTDANILLTGENGTGKTLLANYIHLNSERKNEPFIDVDLGCITESLFESEMFGHVKGAFTDAKENKIGRFELANDGTIFLDEIANIGVSQQSKLLRVLESNQFEKVGSSKTHQVNVRIIVATNAKLTEMIEEKTFRQDLFYRLNTFEINIPSLRERKEDIIPLIKLFITKYSHKYCKGVLDISKEAEKLLTAYHWPGNVRELSHIAERMVLLSDAVIDANLILSVIPNELFLDDMKQADMETIDSDSQLSNDFMTKTADEIEQILINKRLEFYEGNATNAAKSLGLSRSAFYRRLGKQDENE